MTFDDSFWRALADYQLKFTDVKALGDGNPPAIWYTEYQRVSDTAFAAALLTANAFEGGSSSGQKGFSQETLLDALHCRRFALDCTYELPAHLHNFPVILERKLRAGLPRVLMFQGRCG